MQTSGNGRSVRPEGAGKLPLKRKGKKPTVQARLASQAVCQHCGAAVRNDRLSRHLKERCLKNPARLPESKVIAKKRKPTTKAKTKSRKKLVSSAYSDATERIRFVQGGLCSGS
jgi:hypothetical protein